MIIRYANFFHTNKSMPILFAMVIPEKEMVSLARSSVLEQPQIKDPCLAVQMFYLWKRFSSFTSPVEVPLLSTFSANCIFFRKFFIVVVRTHSTLWTYCLSGLTTLSLDQYLTFSYLVSFMSSLHQLGFALCRFHKENLFAGELFLTADYMSQPFPERDHHLTVVVPTIFYRECQIPHR